MVPLTLIFGLQGRVSQKLSNMSYQDNPESGKRRRQGERVEIRLRFGSVRFEHTARISDKAAAPGGALKRSGPSTSHALPREGNIWEETGRCPFHQ